jgi:hypothetical protein
MAVFHTDREAMKYKGIAAIMGIPLGTVMSRVHRSRRHLRGRLAHLARERGYLTTALHDADEDRCHAACGCDLSAAVKGWSRFSRFGITGGFRWWRR